MLDALDAKHPITKPMFGCTAVYVGEKIVLILRERKNPVKDDGIWLATTHEHHASLKKDFPAMRSISIFGKKKTGWQVLPVDHDEFEEMAMKACLLILKNDPRIGKIPRPKKKKSLLRKKRS